MDEGGQYAFLAIAVAGRASVGNTRNLCVAIVAPVKSAQPLRRKMSRGPVELSRMLRLHERLLNLLTTCLDSHTVAVQRIIGKSKVRTMWETR